MRTIKFRVWDDVSNVMDYDFIHHETNGDKYFVDIQDGELTVGDVDKNNDYYELILMQFTGLKDKNGREIYEGDIISDNKNTFRVYSLPGGFGIKAPAWSHDKSDLVVGDYLIITPLADAQTQDWISTQCEVIGNIHENK